MAMGKQISCPRCGGRMKQGSILNKDSNGGRSLVAWVEGKPERSAWTGLKIKGLQILDIASYRCDGCGYLENYAAKS